MGVERAGAKDLAYFTDGWIWPSDHVGLMKVMLLFFDGITLSLPQDIATKVIERQGGFVADLADCGLLINIDPDTALSSSGAQKLTRHLISAFSRYRPQAEAYAWPTQIYETSPSRGIGRRVDWWNVGSRANLLPGGIGRFHWGGEIASYETRRLTRLMLRNGIARPLSNEEPLSGVVSDKRLFQVDGAARMLILAAYSRILQSELIKSSDTSLQPVTLNHQASVLGTPIHLPAQIKEGVVPTVAAIVAEDLESVVVDLTNVPIDEILDFKAENLTNLRAYQRGLRELIQIAGTLSSTQVGSELEDGEPVFARKPKNLGSQRAKPLGRRPWAPRFQSQELPGLDFTVI